MCGCNFLSSFLYIDRLDTYAYIYIQVPYCLIYMGGNGFSFGKKGGGGSFNRGVIKMGLSPR